MKRRKEGYLLIDHRASPGITEQDIIEARLKDVVPVAGGKILECKTHTCVHCGSPAMVSAGRGGYCFNCDGYLCEAHACNKECIPLSKVFDHAQEQAFRSENSYNLLAPLYSSQLVKGK